MSESDKTDRNKGKSKSKNKKKSGCSWALRVFLLAVALSALLSFFSSTALEGTGYAVAIIVLAVFIALGIVFDMIGVAVTAADPKPFHSMAAHKEKGAKEAIRLLKTPIRSAPSATTWWATSAASSAAPRRLSSWWSCRRT